MSEVPLYTKPSQVDCFARLRSPGLYQGGNGIRSLYPLSGEVLKFEGQEVLGRS